MNFRGTYTALVTPFRDGAFDEAAYERLIEWQIESEVAGIVPVGTTGESPTLDYAEHNRVIEVAVKAARGRCKVIAGTGSNSDRKSTRLNSSHVSISYAVFCLKKKKKKHKNIVS